MVGCRAASWMVAISAAIATAAAGCLESPPDDGEDLDCPGNLIGNPSFEDGTYGWGGTGSELSLSEGGRIGDRAVEVCSTGARADFYTLDDNPQTVPDPKQGERYDVSLWLRAVPAQDLNVVMREWDADTPSNTPAHYMIGEDWTPATGALLVALDDPAAVDVYVSSTDAEAGNCFQVDAICMIRRE